MHFKMYFIHNKTVIFQIENIFSNQETRNWPKRPNFSYYMSFLNKPPPPIQANSFLYRSGKRKSYWHLTLLQLLRPLVFCTVSGYALPVQKTSCLSGWSKGKCQCVYLFICFVFTGGSHIGSGPISFNVGY